MRAALAAVLLLLVSGCVSSSPSSQDEGQPTATTGRTSSGPGGSEGGPVAKDYYVINGTYGTALGEWIQTKANTGGMIHLGQNATHVHIDLRWTSLQNRTDLDVEMMLAYPNLTADSLVPRATGQRPRGAIGNYAGSFNAPDIPAILDVPAEKFRPLNVCATPPCRWYVHVYVDGIGQDVAYQAIVRVTYPPSNATAPAP